jgi:preprotein translocase subunit YajC
MGLVLQTVIAAALLGMMFYFFFSKKSSRGLRLLALTALIMSALAVGVCGFFLVFGAKAGEEEAALELLILNEGAPPAEKPSVAGLIIFLVVLVVFFAVIIFLGIRDQRKKAVESAIAAVNDSDLEKL